VTAFVSLGGFLREKKLHTKTLWLIMNMAFADLLTGLCLCPYVGYVYINDGLLQSKWHCHWNNALAIVFIGQSLFTNLLLSVERFIAICHPFKHGQLVTKKRLLTVVISGWVYCVCLSTVPLETEKGGWDAAVTNCSTRSMYPFSFLVAIYAHVLVTVLANVVLQVQVVKQMCIQHKRIENDLQASTEEAMSRKSELKKGKVSAVLFLVFMACFGPYLLSSPATVLAAENTALLAFRDIAFVLGTSNAFVNFFIYGWKFKELRIAIKKFASCKPI
jgi:hypothetical protein